MGNSGEECIQVAKMSVFIPLLMAAAFGGGVLIFLATVFHDYTKSKKLKRSAVSLGCGTPKYRITKCEHPPDSPFDVLYRVEWLTYKGWTPCMQWVEGCGIEVSFVDKINCEKYIKKQLSSCEWVVDKPG